MPTVNIKPKSSTGISEKLQRTLAHLDENIDSVIQDLDEIYASVTIKNGPPISKHDYSLLLENRCKAVLLKSDQLPANDREPLILKALKYGNESLVNQPEYLPGYTIYALAFEKYSKLTEPSENYKAAIENEKERKLLKDIQNTGKKVVENLKKGLLIQVKDKSEIHKAIQKCLQCMYYNVIEYMEGESEDDDLKEENLFEAQQFVHSGFGRNIMELKEKEYFDRYSNSKQTHLKSKMYTLVIQLLDIRPMIWRRFKVPGSITLASLQDRVISPIMGWCRNYHAYYFRKAPIEPKKMLTDSIAIPNCVFGPIKSLAVDKVHQLRLNVRIVDDSKVELYQLLEKKGDEMQFVYDLGDWWAHRIYVQEIEDGGETQPIVVEDGENSCPPEDCGSSHTYVAAIQALLYGGSGCNENFTSDRSYNELMRRLNGPNVNKKQFDPLYFSLAETKRQLQNGLRTEVSALDQSNFTHFFHQSGVSTTGKFKETELLSKKPVKSCVICQSTSNLKQCSSCRSVYYCCREHQVKDWSDHKKICGKEK